MACLLETSGYRGALHARSVQPDSVTVASLIVQRSNIVSGIREPRFHTLLARMVSKAQGNRIADALAPLMEPRLAAMSLPFV
ncbi:hypothetical protein [Paraburkholderia saeva]|uniref:hypothetical protein n=1 Tax=Paraburkholderia saeva TaxID=2777537 RepID=UPI001E5731B8|nr:hypothetical protein [Paraburkholderia saeva]